MATAILTRNRKRRNHEPIYKFGLESNGILMTPEEFDKFLRGDIVKWAEVVKKFPEKPQ